MAVNPTSTLLAIGCEDGCVRLISIEDGEFNLQRKLDRVKCRILSIAWGPPHVKAQANRDDESDDEEEWEDTFLVTGCSDSSLRKWDVKSGRVLERMSTDRTRSERTLVWAVGVLAYVILLNSGLVFIYYYQRRYHRVRRLDGYGQILGC